MDQVARFSDAILLDTTGTDLRTGDPLWSANQTDLVLARFADRTFEVTYDVEGIYLLQRT